MLTTPRQPNTLLKVFGGILLGAGSLVVWFVANELYTAYNTPDTHHFLSKIAQTFTKTTLVSQNNQPSFVLEAGGAELLALVLLLLFTIPGLSLGFGLISAGMRVLSPQFSYQVERLKRRLDALAMNIRQKLSQIGR